MNNLPLDDAEPIIKIIYKDLEEEQERLRNLNAVPRANGRRQAEARNRRVWNERVQVRHVVHSSSDSSSDSSSTEDEEPVRPVRQQRPIGGPNDNEVFWNMINSIQWIQQPADGAARVNRMFAENPDCRQIFRAEYSKSYGTMLNAMVIDRMFDAGRHPMTPNQIVANVSSMVAMGREVFNTMIMDMEMCQNMIDPACTSFDALLPREMRMQ